MCRNDFELPANFLIFIVSIILWDFSECGLFPAEENLPRDIIFPKTNHNGFHKVYYTTVVVIIVIVVVVAAAVVVVAVIVVILRLTDSMQARNCCLCCLPVRTCCLSEKILEIFQWELERVYKDW